MMLSEAKAQFPVGQQFPAGQQLKQAELVIIDADTVLLESLPQALSSHRRLKVCGRALDVQNGLEICRALDPDLLLVSDDCFRSDFRLLANFLPIRTKQLRLAVFADRLTDRERMQAIAVLARGFLSRKDSVIDVNNALARIEEGHVFVSPHLQDRLIVNEDEQIQITSELTFKKLTNLQLQVFVYLAEGQRVKDVAKKMHLSMKAVESHKYRIMQVLGVHDRLGLCRLAIREGMIEP